MSGILKDTFTLLLAEGGIGYAVAIVSWVAMFFLYRELRACHRERIDEAMRLVVLSEQLRQSISANTLAQEANNQAMESRARAGESLERTILAVTKQQEMSHERLLEALRDIQELSKNGIARAEELRLILASRPPFNGGSQ